MKKVQCLLTLTILTSLFSISQTASVPAAEPSHTTLIDESGEIGWIQSDGLWIYINPDGTRAYSQWILPDEDDGRGNLIYYYIDSDGYMAADETKIIDGQEITFNEDGSYVVYADQYKGAPRGKFSGKTFENPWSGIRLTFPAVEWRANRDELDGYLEYFNDDDYLAVGKPKLTYDFQVEPTANGDLIELYYADLSALPQMTAGQFAEAMAEILYKTDTFTQREPLKELTLGDQTYQRLSLANESGIRKEVYLRRQDSFMVILSATADADRVQPLINLIHSIKAPKSSAEAV